MDRMRVGFTLSLKIYVASYLLMRTFLVINSFDTFMQIPIIMV